MIGQHTESNVLLFLGAAIGRGFFNDLPEAAGVKISVS
jgi:hypothetical protein